MCGMCTRQHSSLLLRPCSRYLEGNKRTKLMAKIGQRITRKMQTANRVVCARAHRCCRVYECMSDAVCIWSNQLPYLWTETRTKLWWCITDLPMRAISSNFNFRNWVAHRIRHNVILICQSTNTSHFQESIAQNSMQNDDECGCHMHRHQHHEWRACACANTHVNHNRMRDWSGSGKFSLIWAMSIA